MCPNTTRTYTYHHGEYIFTVHDHGDDNLVVSFGGDNEEVISHTDAIEWVMSKIYPDWAEIRERFYMIAAPRVQDGDT